MKLIIGGKNYNPNMRGIPKYITIAKPSSEIAWFRNLVGLKFEVLEVNEYNYVKICYNSEFDLCGWLPLECCKTHLSIV